MIPPIVSARKLSIPWGIKPRRATGHRGCGNDPMPLRLARGFGPACNPRLIGQAHSLRGPGTWGHLTAEKPSLTQPGGGFFLGAPE
jgi:hypothetical protein